MIKQKAQDLRVEIAKAETVNELTKQINYFLEKNPDLIIQDIKYNTCSSACGNSDDIDPYSEYSALIIYLHC